MFNQISPKLCSSLTTRVASRYARFHEGPEGAREFDEWMEDQPESFRDEWEANTEEYGDQFKTAARNDPYWMVAKYPGKDADGKPVRRGDRVFYYPSSKTMLTGEKAAQAARDFNVAVQDEDFWGR